MAVAQVTDEQRALVPDHVPAELIRPIDIYDHSEGAQCPYAQLSALHSGPPILYLAPTTDFFGMTGGWLLTRADDIRAVMQNADVFSSKGIAGFSRLVGESWDLVPLELDPPEHAKYRAILNSFFSPTRINAMEDGVRARARALIEKVADKGECEFMEAFGRPFPISIFMQLMGLPDQDMKMLVDWEHDLLHSSDIESRLRGAKGFLDYLRAVIKDRKAHPGDDLTTIAVQAKVDGQTISDDMIMGICYLLVVAGLDTVASSLSLHFRHLALNSVDQEKLRANPALIPGAVEEFLRAYSIVTTSRYATQDFELDGITIKKGDRVVCNTALGSLDPAEFEDPMTVDIERSPNRHVAFSYGPHRCLGSHLARRELIIAQQEWLKCVPPFRTKGNRDVPINATGLFNASELPLEWSLK